MIIYEKGKRQQQKELNWTKLKNNVFLYALRKAGADIYPFRNWIFNLLKFKILTDCHLFLLKI